MNWKLSMAGFFCILAGACVIPFVTLEEQNTITEPPKQEIIVVSTNSITSTNAVDRAKPQYNLDWFKDSSNYIWDGWKIK
jgi:hypothetical protein